MAGNRVVGGAVDPAALYSYADSGSVMSGPQPPNNQGVSVSGMTQSERFRATLLGEAADRFPYFDLEPDAGEVVFGDGWPVGHGRQS